MTEQVQEVPRGGDVFKLVAAAVVVVAGFVAYYYFSDLPAAVRWLMVLAGLVGGVFVALQSAQGAQFWQFVQSSRGELRKVVWPSKDESWKLTLLVFVVVIILGLFFWMLDGLLGMLTRWLTSGAA
ncbi:MAG: preprotein translocase subunit SecE [Steroidobacteraceae bacterium]